MVLVNKATNEITVKLVYYGPGLCGKTTNLEKIYGNDKIGNKGKMISMATETDRTLFFDFMPMDLGTVGGQKIKVTLYTVPGQVFYDATRKLVLRGADGVVFVADSQKSMKDSNIQSLDNLYENLRINRLDPEKIALVFQLNKRDLSEVSSPDEMKAYLGVGDHPVVEASALQGQGVSETLRKAVAKILENLKNNVDYKLSEEDHATAMQASAESSPANASPEPVPAPFEAASVSPEASGPQREELQAIRQQTEELIGRLESALQTAKMQSQRLGELLRE
ncbi:MAG: GTPase domain-containing protein [Acidobacteria bacterium]|nr:GTPase domain-containing protein [Acidobacteriota bacterium]